MTQVWRDELPQLISVRMPTITDAVGAGMAHYAMLAQSHRDLADAYDSMLEVQVSEEALVQWWHEKLSHVRQRKIAVATLGRRVIGMALVEPTLQDAQLVASSRPVDLTYGQEFHIDSSAHDDTKMSNVCPRYCEKPSRPLELVFLNMLNEYYDDNVLQRLFDFVVGNAQPMQTWVERNNRTMRSFLRMNGFTLDGVETHTSDGQSYVRMTR